jgi:transcriptional regulator with XRE-family HTH domain
MAQQFADRLRRAWLQVQADEGVELNQGVLAERLSALLERTPPYSQASVSRWLRGESEPDELAVYVALARILGVRAGWLAFGEEPATPPVERPDGPETRDAQDAADSVSRWTAVHREAAEAAARRSRRKPG